MTRDGRSTKLRRQGTRGGVPETVQDLRKKLERICRRLGQENTDATGCFRELSEMTIYFFMQESGSILLDEEVCTVPGRSCSRLCKGLSFCLDNVRSPSRSDVLQMFYSSAGDAAPHEDIKKTGSGKTVMNEDEITRWQRLQVGIRDLGQRLDTGWNPDERPLEHVCGSLGSNDSIGVRSSLASDLTDECHPPDTELSTSTGQVGTGERPKRQPRRVPTPVMVKTVQQFGRLLRNFTETVSAKGSEAEGLCTKLAEATMGALCEGDGFTISRRSVERFGYLMDIARMKMASCDGTTSANNSICQSFVSAAKTARPGGTQNRDSLTSEGQSDILILDGLSGQYEAIWNEHELTKNTENLIDLSDDQEGGSASTAKTGTRGKGTEMESVEENPWA